MEVEARLLLYTVVLGAGVGLVQLVRRRAHAFRVYKAELAALLAVSVVALLLREWTRPAAWPAFGAFAAVAIVPPGLLEVARRAARQRRYGLASMSASVASGILGRPAPLRREAALYGAMAAAERGDDEGCRLRLERLAGSVGIPPELGGDALVRILPAAARRRWAEVLDALGAAPTHAPTLLAVEARAAADTGDFVRALRACRDIDRFQPGAAAARWASRRSVLAAAGCASFLAEAAERRMPLLSGPPGTADLAIARAHEARGEARAASERYASALRDARGAARLDAEDGARRCADGALILGTAAASEAPALREIEAACRAERPSAEPVPVLRRAPFTFASSLVTLIASVVAFLALGTDTVSLLASGALSAPLITHDGQWWRLGSAMLLHGGWVHLGMNLGSILFVGIPLESRIGWSRTAIVYVVPGLVASMASAFLARTDVGVGASGAAMGLVGALGVLLVRRPALFHPDERRRWIAALGITVIATLAVGLVESESIDNAAHIAGFVGGVLTGWLLLPGAAEGRVGVAVRRMAAILVCGVVLDCGAAAAIQSGTWLGERTVAAAGARAELPRWLRLRAGPGVVASLPVLGFAVQVGAAGTPANPDLLLPPDAKLRRAFAAGPTRSEAPSASGDLRSECLDYADAAGAGLRLRSFRRGAAFALVMYTVAGDGDTEGDEIAFRIGRSLAPVE